MPSPPNVDPAAAGHPWDPDGLAAGALAEVVAAFGKEALADEESLANRLSDLLPADTLHREQRLLLAASRRRVAAELEERMSQGIGIGATLRLSAGALYEEEPFDQSGCEWVVDIFAQVLGFRTEPETQPLESEGPLASPAETAPAHDDLPVPLADAHPVSAGVPAYQPPVIATPLTDQGIRPRVDAGVPVMSAPRIYPRAQTARASSQGRRKTAVLASSIVVVLAAAGITAAVLTGSSTDVTSTTTSSPTQPVRPLVWSSSQAVDTASASDGGIAGVSCEPSGSCVAVDNDGNALKYVSGSWSRPRDVDDGVSFDAISCPTSAFCTAVDNNGDALTYLNGTWSQPDDIDGGNSLNAVSCPTSAFCMAVDNDGNALTYLNGTWSQPNDMDSSNTLDGVSCPTSAFCLAVDNAGNAITYDDGTWSQPSDVDAGNDLGAVWCSSATLCTAVDDNGSALSYESGTWTPPDDFDQSNTLSSVSCPSSSFCVAVDQNGNAFSLENGKWSQPDDIDGTSNLNAVSCSTADFCVAVDEEGDVFTARPG